MEKSLLLKCKVLTDSGIQRQQVEMRNIKLYKAVEMRSKLDEKFDYKLDDIFFNYQSVYLADRRHIAATCIC